MTIVIWSYTADRTAVSPLTMVRADDEGAYKDMAK